MQVAINIVLFFLGLYLPTIVALRRRKGQKIVDFDLKAIDPIREIIDGLTGRSTSAEQRTSDRDQSASGTAAELLLTPQQVVDKYDTSCWQRLAFEDFKTTIMAGETGLKTFPCIYATMGFRAGDHRYVFLESDDPSEPRNVKKVAPALRAYLAMSRSLGPNNSMVIMAAPTERGLKSVEEYNNGFWEMLRGLRIWDSKPWPEQFPASTHDDKWTYCFDGQPLFPVALTPAHRMRWSRHASVPTIALQPKWVIDNLLATPDKRNHATAKVRNLLSKYDQVAISPDLTDYGSGTSEIHQLCLRDENEAVDIPFDDFDKGGCYSSRRISGSSS